MDLQGDAGVTQRSRAGDALITPPFETIWPDVERRLRALLYRRGLDQPSIDDIVQEVALRVLAGRVTYTSAKDLLRWAGPVACNLHIDLLRQRARLHDGAVGDRPAWNDVAGEVADRMELQRAFRGIAALRPADREAIIEAVADEQPAGRSRKESVRLAVRRHRARSRLVVVLEQLAAWVAGLSLLRRSRVAVTALAGVPVMAALPLMLTWPGAHDGGASDVRPVITVTRPVEYRPPLAAPAAAPKPAVKAARSATVSQAVAGRETVAPRKKPVDVKGPRGVRVRAGGDDRREDDRIICHEQPPLPRICV